MKQAYWVVADTVRTDRKDIFCFSEDDRHHVGTIISGSRRYLNRFERQVALMRRCPDMRTLLERIVSECLESDSQVPSLVAIAADAKRLLDDIERPYQEG